MHLSLKIAVVIATCNRLNMLAERSLLSVTAQTKYPDTIVVVDDSIKSARNATAELVKSLAARL